MGVLPTKSKIPNIKGFIIYNLSYTPIIIECLNCKNQPIEKGKYFGG